MKYTRRLRALIIALWITAINLTVIAVNYGIIKAIKKFIIHIYQIYTVVRGMLH
jgi:hypothetical protein